MLQENKLQLEAVKSELAEKQRESSELTESIEDLKVVEDVKNAW